MSGRSLFFLPFGAWQNKEHGSMTRKLTDQSESSNFDCAWRVELPVPIEANWHPKWGSLLAGFPLELVYSGTPLQNDKTRRSVLVRARYSVDPSSFHEDDAKTVVRYTSALPSEYFVAVTWDKIAKRWLTTKFHGNRLLAQATGTTFERVMIQTLLVGLEPDEPAA
jgi:hypothetical protein